VLQVVPLHAKGAHGSVLAAWQVPAPSHVRARVCMVAPTGHEGGAHVVPAAYSWHAPWPSHAPVLPQLVAPWSLHVPVGSAPFRGTGAQVPADVATAHDMHVPVQAVRQQTPCAQKPLAHSLASPHVAPGDLRPHDPALHTDGARQSASEVHVALHADAPHLYGAHEVAAGVTHAPAPSQLEPGV
jgi:hypothetical protein